jgi:aspartate aminotransferase-like enzyme
VSDGVSEALSLPPDLGIVTVSARAWAAVEARGYEGYDALLPFRAALERRLMPYTHNWRAVEALAARLAALDLPECLARHEVCSRVNQALLSPLLPGAFTVANCASLTETSAWRRTAASGVRRWA